jgi:predicted esterase
MGSGDDDRLEQLYRAALARAPGERDAFLRSACSDDETLYDVLRSRLQEGVGSEASTAFLDTGAGEPAPPARRGSFAPGTRLGPYEIVAPLGAGGMGEVYVARHVKLGREAAVKVLPPEVASSPSRLRRFQREARAASALNHPAIVTIYDIDEHQGTTYLAMELVGGVTLGRRLALGPLAPREALRIAVAMAEGLARAHEAGIVHRDLKPENVMLTEDGHVKILDFGLAKVVAGEQADGRPHTTLSLGTQEGMVVGTIPYMSPEQAAGKAVDPLSDQFSFGVVLYEMLCGRRPFVGDSAAAVLSAILRDAPPPPRTLRPDLPRELEQVVRRCLEKEPGQRHPGTGVLVEALRRCEEGLAPRSGAALAIGRGGRVAAAALLLLGLGAAAWFGLRDRVVRWQERETIARAAELTESGELYEAWRLARGLAERLPGDPEVAGMIERITLPIAIATEPSGATVELKAYASADAPWVKLGETPLLGIRVPYALAHWRISKPGFETFEGAPFGVRPFTSFAQGFPLAAAGSRPEGMVRVPGGPYQRAYFPPVELPPYWLDRYEVTNREFKAFVDAGAYGDTEPWPAPFRDGENEIPFEAAMERLVDRTGRPGPAGWEFGAYDEDEADEPVGGVSWYEAAAYCRYAGKSLPTLYHWYAATAQDQLSDILPASNFAGEGPAPVGSYLGLGDFGTYDMAGNVKEWCWNEMEDGRRYALGGSWGEPTYTFNLDSDSRAPFSRGPDHGFRCASFDAPPDDSLLAPVTPQRLAGGPPTPVGDAVFAAYTGIYAYDRDALAASVDAVDDSSPHWRKETVSFTAAYGGERVIAHLFLPRNAAPPYQPVVWFPGNDAFFLPPGGALASPYLFDFVARSGRALVYPVYKGLYERRVPFSFTPNEWRDMIVVWAKDLGRTVDYLEERQDMDTEKLGYYGFSAGAVYGPILTAVDGRFAASVLLGGGLMPGFLPEVNAVNFAPRTRVPTLMISGEDDFIMPLETSQLALFRLLGAPADRKRHARLAGGHIPPDRLSLIEEVTSWFDRFLGPVAQRPAGAGS